LAADRLSPRLRAVVDALPLRPGLRVVEIGCGPGAAVRAVADRVGPTGHVLAVDRSPRAIEQVRRAAADLIAAGRVSVRQVAVEDLVLRPAEAPYDLAFAVRVGALDGRHPDAGVRAGPGPGPRRAGPRRRRRPAPGARPARRDVSGISRSGGRRPRYAAAP